MLFKLTLVFLFLKNLQNEVMGTRADIGFGIDVVDRLAQSFLGIGKKKQRSKHIVRDCPNPLDNLAAFKKIPMGMIEDKSVVIRGVVSSGAERVDVIFQTDSGDKRLNFSLQFPQQKIVASTFFNNSLVNEKKMDGKIPVGTEKEFLLDAHANIDSFYFFLGRKRQDYLYDYIKPSSKLKNFLVYGNVSVVKIEVF